MMLSCKGKKKKDVPKTLHGDSNTNSFLGIWRGDVNTRWLGKSLRLCESRFVLDRLQRQVPTLPSTFEKNCKMTATRVTHPEVHQSVLDDNIRRLHLSKSCLWFLMAQLCNSVLSCGEARPCQRAKRGTFILTIR